MSQYAAGTSVPVDRSKAEIERILARYGAERFGYMTDGGRASIGFQCNGRAIRMTVELPKLAEFERTPKGKRRTADAQLDERDREVRRRWRSLALIVKAKLEAVESGITTFESEWLPYMVTTDGRTVAERMLPELDTVLATRGSLMLGMDS